MRVWIVNPYDNLPLEGYRPQRFWLMARAFVRAGCEVVYWTSAFSHANKRQRVLPQVKVTAEGEAQIADEGLVVRLVKTPGYRANIGLGRIVDHQVLAYRWRKMVERAERPDLIIASSPPLSLVAAVRKFAEERGVPYIVDVMDAWPETFERVVPKGVLKALGLYRRAWRNYGGAAGISVVARRYAELVRGYGYPGEVREFLHGIDGAARAVIARGRDDAVGGDHRTVPALGLVYAGNMSLSYDLETVLKAVRSASDVTLDLAGYGPDAPRLRSLAEGCDRIRFHGYLGRKELESLLSRSDAGVIPMFAASCVGVPYKLADYAAAGLPVLNSLEGETAELVAKYGAGISYRAGDAASLKRAVELLRAASRAKMSEGARRMAVLFDADRIYADYVQWAMRVGKSRAGGRPIARGTA